MAKRSHPRAKGSNLKSLSSDTLQERGQAALDQRRFREAVDIYKALVRQEPRPIWVQALADATVGRATDLATKGLFKEASVVLESGHAIDCRLRAPVLFLSCLLETGQADAALDHCLRCVGHGDLALTDREWFAEAAAVLLLTQRAACRIAAADTLPAMLADAGPASAALAAWSVGHVEEAWRLARTIPLASPFRTVRVMLKSWRTASEDRQRAVEHLSMVPDSSVFFDLRSALTAAYRGGSAAERLSVQQSLPAEQRGFAATVAGVPVDRLASLETLEAAQARGSDALFVHLLRHAERFPEKSLRNALIALLPELPKRRGLLEKRFGPLSRLEHQTVVARERELSDDCYEAIERAWSQVVATLIETQSPDADQVCALIHRRLADVAKREDGDGEDLTDAPLQNAMEWDPVVFHLACAFKADPEDATLARVLIDHLRAVGATPAWHEVAERAAVHRPDDVTILLDAMEAVVERQAFRKAAGYAKRILAQDPINQTVRRRMIGVLRAHARKKMAQNRPDLAAKTLGEADQWQAPGETDHGLRISQGLAALARGEETEGRRVVVDAVQLAGHAVPGWIEVAMEVRLMRLPENGQVARWVSTELRRADESAPTVPAVLALASLFNRAEMALPARDLMPLLRRIDRWLKHACHLSWTVDAFHQLADALRASKQFALLNQFAETQRRRMPGEAAFEFYVILGKLQGRLERATHHQFERLQALFAKATDCKDGKTASRINQVCAKSFGTGKGISEPFSSAQDIAMVIEELVPVIASIVEDMGRRSAIKLLCSLLKRSPIGVLFKDEQLQSICEILVDRYGPSTTSPVQIGNRQAAAFDEVPA